MDDSKRLIYSTKDVKDILGIGNSYIHELLTREENPIPHFKIGRRYVIPCDLFQQWMFKEVAGNMDIDTLMEL